MFGDFLSSIKNAIEGNSKALNIKQAEIGQITNRVERYISENGYTSVKKFIDYFDHAPEFQTAREFTYDNPEYRKHIETINLMRKYGFQPAPLTETPQIGYGKYASLKYKEIVAKHIKLKLPDIIKSFYIFDFGNLYEALPEFQDFFKNDNGEYGQLEQFAFVCVTGSSVTEQEKQGVIETLGGKNKNIFRSTIIPESEGNLIVGDTIEISLDD